MSIFDAIGNAEYKQHLSLLATLIKMSAVDGKIDDAEWKIIEKVAEKYGFDEEALKYLKKNYENYSLDTPFSLEERIQQLYDLTRLAFADGHLEFKELRLLLRSVLGLGFPPDKAESVFEAAVNSVKNNEPKEKFFAVIKDIVTA